MKKLLTLVALGAIFATTANAQNSTSETKQTKKELRQEKYQNASSEEKARMDGHKAMMKKLSPEQKAAVKKEMERHRQEMKKITGVELPMPSAKSKSENSSEH